MHRADLAPRIDHTVLGPETTPADVQRLVDEATEYNTNACIPPAYVADVRDRAPELTLVTTIGFPHGQHAPDSKVYEAETAWEAGADELDVVANVGRLKSGQDDLVRDELAAVVAAVPNPVKVIIEAPLLTDTEKHRACTLARDADAAYVKTSTGYVSNGATVEDVELMSEYLPVKASGGIDSYDTAVAMIEAGADRIGASSGGEILDGAPVSGDTS